MKEIGSAFAGKSVCEHQPALKGKIIVSFLPLAEGNASLSEIVRCHFNLYLIPS